jgi:hypothetical protein
MGPRRIALAAAPIRPAGRACRGMHVPSPPRVEASARNSAHLAMARRLLRAGAR